MKYTDSEIEEAYNDDRLFVVAQRNINMEGGLDSWVKGKRYKILDADYEEVWGDGWAIETEEEGACLIGWGDGDFEYLIIEECPSCIWTENSTIPKDKLMCDECYKLEARLKTLSKSFDKSEEK